MSGSVVTPVTNILPLPNDITHLQDDIQRGHKMPFQAGLLRNVIEPDGDLVVLACIDNDLIEIPKDQAAILQPLVGRMICLAIVDGKFRAGALRA